MIKKYLPWLLALLYFISPYDVLPDFLVGLGWLDDLAVLGLVFWWVSRLRKASTGGSNSSANYRTRQEASGGGETVEEDPYQTLGVRPGASPEEIKSAYKKLAALYHPDKVQHLGRDFQELAHKKFVEIQKAYETLMH